MDAVSIVILEAIFKNPTEMPFTEDDDPGQVLSANAAIESLKVWILPGHAILFTGMCTFSTIVLSPL